MIRNEFIENKITYLLEDILTRSKKITDSNLLTEADSHARSIEFAVEEIKRLLQYSKNRKIILEDLPR